MSQRLIELLRAYRRRPESRQAQSLPAFVAERDPYLFSHHPASPAFREHVWQVGGLYFCKGCVVTFAGVLAGAVFFLLTDWLRAFSDGEVGAIFALLLVPTLLAHLLPLPRWCRLASRFLLGLLMATAFIMLFVTDSWLVRGIIVLAYFAVRIPLERKRAREHQAAA